MDNREEFLRAVQVEMGELKYPKWEYWVDATLIVAARMMHDKVLEYTRKAMEHGGTTNFDIVADGFKEASMLLDSLLNPTTRKANP